MAEKKINETLKQILNEADKITLDNKEFDNILKEENAILCNMNHILDKKTPEDKKICNKVITKNDRQLNQMIDEFYKMHNLKKPSPDNKTITFGAGVTGTESSASGGYKRATITAGTGNVSWA